MFLCFSFHMVWTVPVSFVALYTSGLQPGVRVPAVVREDILHQSKRNTGTA
jgi:hypothetical protein